MKTKEDLNNLVICNPVWKNARYTWRYYDKDGKEIKVPDPEVRFNNKKTRKPITPFIMVRDLPKKERKKFYALES